MDLTDFRKLGFLQEANRQFFHPLGLALAINVDEDGSTCLAGVWDYRHDPEGITFGLGGYDDSADLAANVMAERRRHYPHRARMFGRFDEGDVAITDRDLADGRDVEPLDWTFTPQEEQ